jgi:hypothetical protein
MFKRFAENLALSVKTSLGIETSPKIHMSDSEYVVTEMKYVDIVEFVPIEGGKPCATTAFDTSEKDEEGFNADITFVFQQLCEHDVSGMALFNSERKVWLKGELNGRKPDFHCKHVIFNGHAIEHHKLHESFLYGGLSDAIFQRQVYFIFEGKITDLNSAALSAMLSYQACRVQNGNDSNPVGVLYNNEYWMHFIYENRELTKVVRGKWTDVGSFNYLQESIQHAKVNLTDNLTKAVIALLAKFNVTPSTDEPFLGRGADGFVFRVKKADGREVALKVCLKSALDEFAILVNAYAMIPDLVIKPIDEAIECELDDGVVCCGYLMDEIGSEVDLRKRSSLIELLSELHQRGFVHGDPRVPNILVVDNKFKFIDFRTLGHGVRFTPIAKEYDLKILVASAYLNANVKQCQKVFSIPSVAERLKSYGQNSTAENAHHFVRECVAYFKKG